uniref:Uncharacterized protein n=1 Tax=Fagus sylvatica TaxID=28930 RepID=A0A2N9HAU7_FAGSY
MPLPLPAIVILFLMISLPFYESSRIINGEEQNLMKKNHFLVPNLPITTGYTPPSTVNQKAITKRLRRQLLKGPVAPSAPNPTTSKRSHNSVPNGGTSNP